MEFSHRLDLFGPEIFAALNDKKVALEAEGRHLFNLSVGTPDFAPADHLKQALIDAASDNNNWKYSLRDLPEMPRPSRPLRTAASCSNRTAAPLGTKKHRPTSGWRCFYYYGFTVRYPAGRRAFPSGWRG